MSTDRNNNNHNNDNNNNKKKLDASTVLISLSGGGYVLTTDDGGLIRAKAIVYTNVPARPILPSWAQEHYCPGTPSHVLHWPVKNPTLGFSG